jgi:hypothetical protein
MSHRPVVDCADGHTFTSWTTEERAGVAGERHFYFARYCAACGLVEETSAAITEPLEPFQYAKTLEAGSEPDD